MSRMFPLTPSLSLKGEGADCADIILWGSLSPQGEGIGPLLTLNIENIRTQMVVVNFL